MIAIPNISLSNTIVLNGSTMNTQAYLLQHTFSVGLSMGLHLPHMHHGTLVEVLLPLWGVAHYSKRY